MKVYRIQKASYGSDISGNGSTLISGRWHRVSRYAMLYTASNRSLAILESLVHLSTSGPFPRHTLLEIEIDDSVVREIDSEALPKGWDNKNSNVKEVQEWGIMN